MCNGGGTSSKETHERIDPNNTVIKTYVIESTKFEMFFFTKMLEKPK